MLRSEDNMLNYNSGYRCQDNRLHYKDYRQLRRSQVLDYRSFWSVYLFHTLDHRGPRHPSHRYVEKFPYRVERWPAHHLDNQPHRIPGQDYHSFDFAFRLFRRYWDCKDPTDPIRHYGVRFQYKFE